MNSECDKLYYKCFYKGLINCYNLLFEVGKEYHIEEPIRYGPNGNGFHVATRLENTLRFFKKENKLLTDDDIDIAIVKCHGIYDEIKDDMESRYSGDYEMYAFEYMTIVHILTHEEIINYMLNLNCENLKKFLMLYKLNDQEKNILKEKNKNNIHVLDYIYYYQDDDKEVFNRRYKIKEKR